MMGDPLDMKQIFFTNLQLLGLDAAAEGMGNKIPFNKNMFDLPNKRGSEVVLHLLFEKLNPVMCKEEFRHCWPIIDKQQEAQFRRTCINWLNNISKNEPDSHLPRITGSLFLSPGGDKFIRLLLHFSRYVLQQDIEKMGGKEKDHIRYPELTQQTVSFGEAIGNSVQCSMVRNRKFLLEESQIILALNREWKEYTNELVKDYRKLSKQAREKDHNIREEIQKTTERGAARGSPMVRKRRSTNAYEYDFDPQSIKRAQRVQEVRDLWKQFDDFCTREASEREVIESIVDKTMNKYKISATDINIKVPDLLLTECQDEIRRRHVDSNFHHGKLNLVSIIQLWNLCLHLYIEKIHQAGVPKFENEVKAIKERVHTSHAYLSNTQALKEQITSILPDLKESIDYLRAKIDKEVTISSTPHSLRTTSVGLGLLEPSPPVSFTPRKETDTTHEGGDIMELTPDDESTPDAVARITDDITVNVRKLFQGTPVYTGSVKQDTVRVTSKLPKKTKTESSTSRTVDVRNQLHSTPTRTVRQSTHFRDWDGTIQQPETLISQMKDSTTRSEQLSHDDSRYKSNVTQSSGTITPKMSPRSVSGPTTPRNQSYHSPLITPRQSQRSPSDMIVDEVMGLGNVVSPVMSGAEAFRTKAEIPRSPIGLEVKMMFQEAMSNENSPRSDRSRSSKGQRSTEHSLNLSNYSSRSQQEQLSNYNKPVSTAINRSLNVSTGSHRSAFEPPHLDELLPSNQTNNLMNENQGRMGMKGSLGSDVELLDIWKSRQENSTSETTCPKSPEEENNYLFKSDREFNTVNKNFKSTDDLNLNRPISPVAELLDSMESENEKDEVLQEDNFKKYDEDDEFYLEQPEGLLTSETEEDNQYELLSKKLAEECKAILTNEVLPRSPLRDEIRHMFKQAVSDMEDSPLNISESKKQVSNSTRRNQSKVKSSTFSSLIDQFDVSQHADQSGNGFDLRSAGDGLFLEDIEMPDMPLDDSFGQNYSSGSLKNNSKKADDDNVRPNLISFASPKAEFNLFQSFDAMKLEEAKHDLDEIFSQSLPLRFKHVQESETKQELNTNKSELQQLEKSIGEIEGKLLELSSNDLNRDAHDDSDIIENLDDSFAPLKGGFLVEGGTPLKSRSIQNVYKALPTEDIDIRTRLQQLKEATSRIKSDYTNTNDSQH